MISKAAKHAVAVANASEEIKSLATEVIGTNEDDSVVKYIICRTNKVVFHGGGANI